MAVTKIINSETKNYKPLLTDKLVLDDAPKSGSFNAITSDAVYKAISVDPGNVPAVAEGDNGKVLTASYSEGEGSFAWATPEAPADELPSIEGNAGKVLAVNSGATGVEWVNFTSISVVAAMPAEPVSGVLYIVTGA